MAEDFEWESALEECWHGGCILTLEVAAEVYLHDTRRYPCNGLGEVSNE